MIEKIDTLIIGAGFAGASTAFHLSAASNRSILILERESGPGLHASGRNAALLLQPVSVPLVRRLNRDSRVAYEKRAAQTGYSASGSLLLGRPSTLQAVCAPQEVESHWIDPQRLPSEIPLLDGYAFEAALQTPTDGVMDIGRLLRFYLEGARS
ncbi:MAG: FAD-dependent oxidoreductase, partial [Acidobacteriota bacterium]